MCVDGIDSFICWCDAGKNGDDCELKSTHK